MPRVVDWGLSLVIEPRVASGSVHSLRLSRVRVRVSLEGVTFTHIVDFSDRVWCTYQPVVFSLLKVST